VVLKTFHNNGKERKEIASEQVSIILGPTCHFFQEKETDMFKLIRERIRAGKGNLRKAGAIISRIRLLIRLLTIILLFLNNWVKISNFWKNRW